jgi:hypothetical protein
MAGPSPFLSKEQVTEAARRYANGEGTPAIAADFNVHAATVRRALIRAGVPNIVHRLSWRHL